MKPRGRHRVRPGRPADEPWARTSDRNTWQAYKNGLALTVTRLVAGDWQALIDGPGVTERSPVTFTTRLLAQAWADNRAGRAR